MAAPARVTRLFGTSVGSFMLGLLGPLWKRNGANLDARNNTDSGYVNVRVADPVAAHDAATKAYVDAGAVTALGPALAVVGTQVQEKGLALSPSALRTFASHPAITGTETFAPYDTTGGTFPLVLPTAASVGPTFVIFTQDITGANGVNPVNVQTTGGDTVEGQTSILVGVPFAGIAFRSDGVSAWVRVTDRLDPQWKNPVLAATVVALPAYTVNGAHTTLTANANGAFPTIDGVAIGLNKNVLVTTGAADADNGKYVLQDAGSAGTPWILRRSADADVTGKITQGSRVEVQQGATWGGQVFVQTHAGPITIGTTPQAWQSTTNPIYFVDTVAGNDANTGTLASPLRTWNGGVWPVIKTLTYCRVAVTYTTTTPDTSPAGLYALGVGVVLTINSPWVDAIGTGNRTVGVGSTTTAIVDSVGGLTPHLWAGTRVRWITGALAGDIYSGFDNNITSFLMGFDAMRSAPVAGDTFAIERAAGGWAPTVGVSLDASAAGAGINTSGFKVFQNTVVGFSIDGGRNFLNGLWLLGIAGTTFTLSGGVNTLGRYYGSLVSNAGRGPAGQRGVGCFISNGVAASNSFFVTQTTITSVDTVMTNYMWEENKVTGQHSNFLLWGQGSVRTSVMSSYSNSQFSQVFAYNTTALLFQIGYFTTVFQGPTTVSLVALTVDNTVVGTPVLVGAGCVAVMTNCVGTAGSAYGVVANPGARVLNRGGNTLVGSTGAVLVNATGVATWPVGGAAPTVDGPTLTALFNT